MGLKEELTSNLKGQIIEYQGKKLYVFEQLDYKENTYICVLHINELPEIVINFLKKQTATKFENVTDDRLFDELYIELGKNAVVNEIEKIAKKLK